MFLRNRFEVVDDGGGGVGAGVFFEAGELGPGIDFQNVGFAGIFLQHNINAGNFGSGQLT